MLAAGTGLVVITFTLWNGVCLADEGLPTVFCGASGLGVRQATRETAECSPRLHQGPV